MPAIATGGMASIIGASMPPLPGVASFPYALDPYRPLLLAASLPSLAIHTAIAGGHFPYWAHTAHCCGGILHHWRSIPAIAAGGIASIIGASMPAIAGWHHFHMHGPIPPIAAGASLPSLVIHTGHCWGGIISICLGPIPPIAAGGTLPSLVHHRHCGVASFPYWWTHATHCWWQHHFHMHWPHTGIAAGVGFHIAHHPHRCRGHIASCQSYHPSLLGA